MTWRPQPNDRFYRIIVRSGLLLRWLFQMPVIVSGDEYLAAPGYRHGASRQVAPGQGAIIAITHFGYLDFALKSWSCGSTLVRKCAL
ncbi:hypothetical protein [Pseudarthrobacter sp. N5]|uniref:hypothetical protein n=1 Tax=Pseudarthrobacter sp. N5 TaxID=3418416 RepID=UPI003CF03A1D